MRLFYDPMTRKLPRTLNGDCSYDLITALSLCDEKMRELIGIGKRRLQSLRTGQELVTPREHELLLFLSGLKTPSTWGDFSNLRCTKERLYLNGYRWQDGITLAELKVMRMTRSELRLIEKQADLIEKLQKERDFYKKQCGLEAKHGLMLWRCFGD